ncbi:hypothetical protein ACF0H5_022968 [Mactra antiquata]
MDFTEYDVKFEEVAEKLLADEISCIYNEEGKNVSRSVRRLVQKFVDEVGHVDSRFKSSEILSVGGFYEGTKVGKADEFDYLVIIDELSAPGVLKANTDGPIKSTFTFVDPDLRARWSEFVDDNQLQHFSCNYRTNRKGRTYGGIMVNMIQQLLPLNATQMNDGTEIILGDDDIDAVVDFVDDEHLTLVSIRISIPNIIINMEWKEMMLSADITPAFRYYNVEDLVPKDQFLTPKLYNKVQEKGSLLLVTTVSEGDKSHFKITFTEIEFVIVKELPPWCIKVYRFLKYVHYICEKKISCIAYRSKLTSYIYKTACILVHLFEVSEDQKVTLYVFNVLSHIFKGLENKHIPSLFSKSQNLFRYEKFGAAFDLVLTSKQEVVLIAQVLQQLLTTNDDIDGLNERTIYRLVATFWRNGGFRGYQNHFVCTHIKISLSQREIIKYRIVSRHRQKMYFKKKGMKNKKQTTKDVLRRVIRRNKESAMSLPLVHGDVVVQGEVISVLNRKNILKLAKPVRKK